MINSWFFSEDTINSKSDSSITSENPNIMKDFLNDSNSNLISEIEKISNQSEPAIHFGLLSKSFFSIKPQQNEIDSPIIDINHFDYSSCTEEPTENYVMSLREIIETKVGNSNRRLIPKELEKKLFNAYFNAKITGETLKRKYKITASQISAWRKYNRPISKRRAETEDFERNILRWFHSQGPNTVTKEKFVRAALTFHKPPFKASDIWVNSFVRKHKLKLKKEIKTFKVSEFLKIK